MSSPKRVFTDFIRHDAMSLAAAVAFYTALSFAPLVLLLVTTGGLLGDSTQVELIRFFDQQLGPRAAEVTQSVVENADAAGREAGGLRWIFGTFMLVLSASAVFGQLQSSLNTIWETEANASSGVWSWLRKRLVSMGMVFTILFILLVALVVSSTIEHIVPAGEELAGRVIAFLASFIVATLLFAAIFKVLPDRRIPWRDVWLGAVVTSVLFSLGKLVVSYYLEHGGVGESYGQAAGALIALLVWVYYSCIILFLGAEITRVYSREAGARADGSSPAPDQRGAPAAQASTQG